MSALMTVLLECDMSLCKGPGSFELETDSVDWARQSAATREGWRYDERDQADICGGCVSQGC